MASFENTGNKLVLQGERKSEAVDLNTRFNFSTLVGFQSGGQLSDAFFNTVVGY